MLRFTLSAVALVGVLATAHPIFADPLAATAPDHAQAAAATEPTLLAPAWSSSDVTVPTPGSGRSVAPAGFGWG
jgi:hypothetical protein